MPYIGNDLATQFQAFATQTITGDGSTGQARERAVANGKELLVYINNVKQEEGSGKSYTASGTTITFSAAVASTDSCYLVYMGSAQQTVTAPDASVGSSQISSADLVLPKTVTIGSAGAEDTKLVFDGNAQDFHVGLDDSADSLTIGLGSALGTTSHMVIDATGAITKPLQPAVQAQISSNQSNISAGSLYTIPFATEVFDQNADYNNSTYTFTAPVTGRYFIGVQATVGGQPEEADYYQYAVQTSNRTYNVTVDPDKVQSVPVYDNFNFIVLADMDASDTCIVKLLVQGSTNTFDFYAETYLSIFLAC